MKIGMPALVEYTNLEELVNLCVKLGLDFIELNMNLPYNFIDRIKPIELINITKNTNIGFTMHMPDELDLGSFYDSVRLGYEKLSMDTLDWARESGIKLLNFHVIEGAKMTLPDRKVYIYEQYQDEYEKNFLSSISNLSKKASDYGITLSIENSHNFGKKYIQNALDKALFYPNVKLTWDTGHDAVSNFTDKQYLMSRESYITHMHLHDAKGTKDHQILFSGDLNIRELLEFACDRNITVLLEVKTSDAIIQSVANLRDTDFFTMIR